MVNLLVNGLVNA